MLKKKNVLDKEKKTTIELVFPYEACWTVVSVISPRDQKKNKTNKIIRLKKVNSVVELAGWM